MSDSTTQGNDEHERFLARLWRDIEGGSARSLDCYLREFPGNPERVAREYLEVLDVLQSDAEDDSRRIAHFETVRELGRGGQGIVYLARDLNLSREVALKVLGAETRLSPRQLRRFQQEAEIASRLFDPGICPVYEVGSHRGEPYIAMRYVEGETLAARIAQTKATGTEGSSEFHFSLGTTWEADPALETPSSAGSASTGGPAKTTTDPKTAAARSVAMGDLNQLLALVERVARTLHKAHEAGVVHRDIKPGNIMIDRDGQPVILDFGLATDESLDASLTQTGEVLGTPAYMSPEQISGISKKLDRRTDVYSLGVTLYECVTLRRPFDAPTRSALYKAILEQEPEDARRLNAAIPRDLAVVIAMAMDKDRDRRYQTAEHLAEDLRRIRQKEPILARPAGPILRLRRWSQRNPALAATVAAIFVLLLTSTVIFVERSRRIAGEKQKTEQALGRLQRETDRVRVGVDLANALQIRESLERLWPPTAANLPRIEEVGRQIEERLATGEAVLERLEALRRRGDPSPADAVRLPPSVVADLDRIESAIRDDLKFFKDDEAVLAGIRAERDRLAAARERVLELAEGRGFSAKEDRWEYETSQRLAIELAYIEAPRSLRDQAAERLALARGSLAAIGEEHAEAWRKAQVEAGRGRYGPRPVALQPIEGLVPLGLDEESGLLEFLHVGSHAGPLPRREAGRLVGAKPGELGMILVLVPGSAFRIGALREMSDERSGDRYLGPMDPGILDADLAPFLVSKYELTQGQWHRMTGCDPSTYAPYKTPAGETAAGGHVMTFAHPVETLSWNDCLLWLPRYGLDLPTEAQWEYACRAGADTRWAQGDDESVLIRFGNVMDEAHQEFFGAADPRFLAPGDDGWTTHAPVGGYAPNEFGLFDMHGNVQEFCRQSYYPMSEVECRGPEGAFAWSNPLSRPEPESVTLRGGSFQMPYFLSSCSVRLNAETRNATRPDFGVRPIMRLP